MYDQQLYLWGLMHRQFFKKLLSFNAHVNESLIQCHKINPLAFKPEKLEAMSMWLQLNPPIQNPPKPTANVTMATTAAWLHPANWTQHRRMAGNSKPRSNRQKVKQSYMTPISIQTLFSQLINKYMYLTGYRSCSNQTPSKTTITVWFEWYYTKTPLYPCSY